MSNHLKVQRWRSAPRKSVVMAHLMLCACPGWATQTDILNAPPFIAGAVKPNILFLMDDSQSMERSWLPDQSHFWAPRTLFGTPEARYVKTDLAFWKADYGKVYLSYGHYSRQCNHLAYNPDVVYSPPLDDAGKSLPHASVAEFSNPDYQPFYFVYQLPGINPPMNFDFKADDSVNQAYNPAGFFTECNAPVPNGHKDALTATPSKVFRRVDINRPEVSPWMRQNFQNWLKYYGDRRGVMKTGVKQAFARVTGGYRLGFSVTSYEKADDNTKKNNWKFLDVKDFEADQKRAFFTAVNNSDGDFDTPLRGALAKAGQYFANKAIGQGQDPMQQSCQRNIAILATDGGWTKAGESAGFGAFGVASSRGGGAALGQQDSGAGIDRPFRDSGKDQVVSLADVAFYYYNTDLRNDSTLSNCAGAKNAKGQSSDVCKNDVKGVPGSAYESNGDMAAHQHMTTHTLGLGLNGRVAYDQDYRTKESGAFHEIVKGTRDWTTLSDPGSKKDMMPLSHTDDLWHAAVNGHGQYFSAADSASIVQGITTALGTIKATTGAASAAATTTNKPVAGDNEVFVSSFVSQKWIGDVQSYTIGTTTGVIDSRPENMKWSARDKLDKLDAGDRKIYYRKPKSGDRREFTAANLGSDGLAKHFADFCTGDKKGADGSLAPAQCMSLTPAQQDSANTAEQMVRYLRGEQGQSYYRKRESRLGDIVNAGLLYVGKPNFPYKDDDSYLAFKSTPRPGIVLAGANDGMLHAFRKSDGTEAWAYIPTPVMKNMYKLADTSYPDNHVYLVDGTPQIGDVKGTDGWHTIVVGGLNAGGKGYYALDVTEPENPKPLWEFTHPQLGFSFGNPIITKRTNGQWVVVFASGYNNGTSSDPDEAAGDGKGRLFVLDALTGESVVGPIVTTAGTKDDPSGLAKINVWVEKDRDNTMLRAYGGDLLGNLWRFDIDNKVQPYQQALRLAELRDPSTGQAQSVTTKPALAEIKFNGVPYAMVYVGTGRYLGLSDVQGEPQVQSFYAIKDPLTNSGHGDVRSGAIVQHTMANTPARPITSGGEVDLASKIGWFLDLPGSGERIDVNPVIALDTIFVAGNIPELYTCKVGGSSFVYQFDLKTGSKGSASYEDQALVQGLSVVQIASGDKKGSLSINARFSDTRNKTVEQPYNGPTRQLKRSAWRGLAH